MLRRQLDSQPAAFASAIRRNAKRAMAASDEDTDPRVNSMRDFFMRHVQFGPTKGVAYRLPPRLAEAVQLMMVSKCLDSTM